MQNVGTAGITHRKLPSHRAVPVQIKRRPEVSNADQVSMLDGFDRVHMVAVPGMCWAVSTPNLPSGEFGRKAFQVVQSIPFEKDFVGLDVDLIEKGVDHPHAVSATRHIAQVCLLDIDRRDDHSVVGGDRVLVDIDIGLPGHLIGRKEVVVVKRDGVDFSIRAVEDVDLPIAIAQHAGFTIPVGNHILPEELLHLEVHGLLVRALPYHVTIVIVDRWSGASICVIIPNAQEDLARVVGRELPKFKIRRLPVSGLELEKGPSVP